MTINCARERSGVREARGLRGLLPSPPPLSSETREVCSINGFWKDMVRIKNDYHIRVAKKPSARAAKRITILVSNTYLACGGSIHWVQCLESEVYRAVKESGLECDNIELEFQDRSYICRNRKTSICGRKINATAFDNHRINTTEVEDTPKARLFAEIVTDFLTLEGGLKDEELSGSNTRERFVGTFEYQKRDALPTQETGIPLRGTFKDPQSVSR
jgi:hypothetical protein